MILKKDITETYLMYSKTNPNWRHLCYKRLHGDTVNDWSGITYETYNDLLSNRELGLVCNIELNDDIAVKQLIEQDYLDLGISVFFNNNPIQNRSYAYRKELKGLQRGLSSNSTIQHMV